MPKSRELTVNERAHIFNMYNDGKSSKEIAIAFWRPLRTIQQTFKNLKGSNVSTKNRKKREHSWTNQQPYIQGDSAVFSIN